MKATWFDILRHLFQTKLQWPHHHYLSCAYNSCQVDCNYDNNMQFRAQPTSKSASVSITRLQVKGFSKHSTQTVPNLNLYLNHIHLNKQICDVAVRKDYLRWSLPVLSATFHFPRILELHLRTQCSHLIRVTGRVWW